MATVAKKPINKKKSGGKKQSEKQVNAYRANAKRSTGADTRKGKKRSIQNALKHILCAQRVCLETESKSEFQEFEAYMLDDLQPEGALEELLANKVISYGWKSLLAQGVEEVFFEEAFDLVEVDRDDDEKSSATMLLEFVTGATINLSPFMTVIDYSLFRSLKEFREAQADRRKQDAA
jgi:hypothetical protein